MLMRVLVFLVLQVVTMVAQAMAEGGGGGE
jgi:hypothetical protein